MQQGRCFYSHGYNKKTTVQDPVKDPKKEKADII